MAKKKSIKKFAKKTHPASRFAAVVTGASAGGLAVLKQIFSGIDKNFILPIIVVQHLYPSSDDFIAKSLDACCKLTVVEANEKERIEAGKIYIAPANYHLLVEEDYTLSLTIDPKVNFCRPAIDVLFESAASAYKSRLIGVLLTGANSDGAAGLKKIKGFGGVTIVQDPKTAEVDVMPKSAINLFQVDHILAVQEISKKIIELSEIDLTKAQHT